MNPPFLMFPSVYRWAGLVCVVAMLAACQTPPHSPKSVVVEDRVPPVPSGLPVKIVTGPSVSSSPAVAAVAPSVPGAENAGKPGYYTVKPGDTLIRIGMDAGQNWRDIQRWNELSNPNKIEVGQVLRVAPPEGAMPVVASGVQVSPVTTAPVSGGQTLPAKADAGKPDAGKPEPAKAEPKPVDTKAAPALAMVWPAKGQVVANFNELKNKGISISGQAGDPVQAAADGRVVYAGAGLRGYGNLVILKHNDTYLTAYAHNQKLLVKEDSVVKQGQTIAEMGNTDADSVKLHFEVRRQGKPVDPMGFLPAR